MVTNKGLKSNRSQAKINFNITLSFAVGTKLYLGKICVGKFSFKMWTVKLKRPGQFRVELSLKKLFSIL